MAMFEVTIPFKKGGWYAQEVDADNKEQAASKVWAHQPNRGKHGKIEVKEVTQ